MALKRYMRAGNGHQGAVQHGSEVADEDLGATSSISINSSSCMCDAVLSPWSLHSWQALEHKGIPILT